MVAVYGDFDADGVTATALLSGTLKELGSRVITYLPHRLRDGHGLNLEASSSQQVPFHIGKLGVPGLCG